MWVQHKQLHVVIPVTCSFIFSVFFVSSFIEQDYRANIQRRCGEVRNSVLAGNGSEFLSDRLEMQDTLRSLCSVRFSTWCSGWSCVKMEWDFWVSLEIPQDDPLHTSL